MLFSELCNKEVVSVTTGTRLGRVDDAEIDDRTAEVKRLFIYSRGFFGAISGESDIIIDWDCIETIGPDIILVRCECERPMPHHRKKMFGL